MPSVTVNNFIKQVNALIEKYEYTFVDIEHDLRGISSNIATMMGELTCNEYDEKGILELKNILSGVGDE